MVHQKQVLRGFIAVGFHRAHDSVAAIDIIVQFIAVVTEAVTDEP